jgi:hypothetical protein
MSERKTHIASSINGHKKHITDQILQDYQVMTASSKPIKGNSSAAVSQRVRFNNNHPNEGADSMLSLYNKIPDAIMASSEISNDLLASTN